MAAMQNGRVYHSTALLLPDGRVLSAGSGRFGGTGPGQDQLNAEITQLKAEKAKDHK